MLFIHFWNMILSKMCSVPIYTKTSINQFVYGFIFAPPFFFCYIFYSKPYGTVLAKKGLISYFQTIRGLGHVLAVPVLKFLLLLWGSLFFRSNDNTRKDLVIWYQYSWQKTLASYFGWPMMDNWNERGPVIITIRPTPPTLSLTPPSIC